MTFRTIHTRYSKQYASDTTVFPRDPRVSRAKTVKTVKEAGVGKMTIRVRYMTDTPPIQCITCVSPAGVNVSHNSHAASQFARGSSMSSDGEDEKKEPTLADLLEDKHAASRLIRADKHLNAKQQAQAQKAVERELKAKQNILAMDLKIKTEKRKRELQDIKDAKRAAKAAREQNTAGVAPAATDPPWTTICTVKLEEWAVFSDGHDTVRNAKLWGHHHAPGFRISGAGKGSINGPSLDVPNRRFMDTKGHKLLLNNEKGKAVAYIEPGVPHPSFDPFEQDSDVEDGQKKDDDDVKDKDADEEDKDDDDDDDKDEDDEDDDDDDDKDKDAKDADDGDGKADTSSAAAPGKPGAAAAPAVKPPETLLEVLNDGAHTDNMLVS